MSGCGRCGRDDGTHEWRAVPWDDRYEVSTAGEVRSYRPWRSAPIPHMLTPAPDSHGYLSVFAGRHMNMHRIVALTFIGEKPEGQEIRHLDGDRTHNCLANLVYGTKSENMYDRVRHGTHPWAGNTHCVRGHEFTPENIQWDRNGTKRSCRICKRASWHRWAEATGRKKAA